MSDHQFGLCEWLLPIPGPTAFHLAGSLGYDGVQILDYGGTQNNYPLNRPWVQQAFLQAMEESHLCIQALQLQSLVLNGWMKAHRHSASGTLAREAFRKGIEVCRALSIPNLQVEDYAASAITSEEEFRNTADFLHWAAPLARNEGVQLVYESFANYDNTMRLYEASGRGFRLCFDTLNPLRYRFGDPLEELQRYDLSLIAFIHVKDAPEGFQGSVCLGTGSGLFRDACTLLNRRGYKGWIVSENYYCQDPIGREDPAITAARDLEVLRRSFPGS
ncbi:MAG: sugar phosphate isomerase/epimerase family protein, partial [Oscillospiraceae bacterium]